MVKPGLKTNKQKKPASKLNLKELKLGKTSLRENECWKRREMVSSICLSHGRDLLHVYPFTTYNPGFEFT